MLPALQSTGWPQAAILCLAGHFLICRSYLMPRPPLAGTPASGPLGTEAKAELEKWSLRGDFRERGLAPAPVPDFLTVREILARSAGDDFYL